MNRFSFLNNWHTWVGVILSIPVIIVGFTAIYLSHKDFFKKTFGDSDITYLSTDAYVMSYKDIKDIVSDNEKNTWLATKNGIYRVDKFDNYELVEALPIDEYNQIFAFDNDLILFLGKEGLYAKSGEKYKKVLTGEFDKISLQADNTLLLKGKENILKSKDGLQWKNDENIAYLATVVPGLVKQISKEENEKSKKISKLMKDLHTGKFLGKEYKWIWGDLVGGACILLSFTGLFMWYKKSKNNRQIAENILAKKTSQET